MRGSEEVKLRPKSFETLRHLVENSGRLISKHELISAVWPDTSVTDDSLVQCLIDVRRALGEDAQQIIKTVPRRGYIFDADVKLNHSNARELVYEDEVERVTVTEEETEPQTHRAPHRHRRWVVRLTAGALVLVALAGVILWLRPKRSAPASRITTLAVLPFRSQVPSSQDDYLGLGMANEIITKISQSGSMTVRPTSAVRKYTTEDIDALQAARELQADAVLDGTYLRVGDRLRITVNLLRVSDGASLWAEKFDQQFTDIFAIQDRVSQQVAQRLWSKLSPAQQARLDKRPTSNPLALSYYAKGMYHFYNIRPNSSSRSDAQLAVELFKKAIELDPEYASAHAQLGYAYTLMAVFQEDNPALVEQAKQELGVAEKIDPQLSEVHLARYYISFSQYEGWSVDGAMRELRLAQQLNPNVGHAELLDFYSHIGLEDESEKEFAMALALDPNNDEAKRFYVNSLLIAGRADEALDASYRFLNKEPDVRYLIEKRMVKEAEARVTQEYQRNPDAIWILVYQSLVKALQGRHKEAQAAVATILSQERRYRGYHHDTYNIARIYALGAKKTEALHWLRVTVAEGFLHYPLLARDPFLDQIRRDIEFTQFLEEMKRKWEGYQREFTSREGLDTTSAEPNTIRLIVANPRSRGKEK